MTGTRWAGAALVGSVLVLPLVLAVGVAPPATAAALPPPPPCATAVAVSTGTTTSAAVPLPAPASALGGAQLAQPGLQVSVPAGVARPPALRATAWIVADLATGDVLAACNAHVPLAPASTLKILTALTLHGRIDANRRYTATAADASMDGTRVGLVPGSVYTVDNLWHGLLMGSGNDAANALAGLAGGTAAATRLMTTTARSLGAADTVVSNTSGLDAPGQVSSVYDLALFGRALLRDPALAALVRTKTYRFPGKGTRFDRRRPGYQIQNHDMLLFTYPGATGIKNGYTTAAGASFVGSATRGGHSYVVALLRTDFASWKLAASLLTWAFATGGRAAPVGRLDAAPVPATGPPPAAAPVTPAPGASPAPTPAGTRVAGAQPARGVTAPVAATLQAIPAQGRTAWIAAAFAVAFAGAAAVGRLARRGTAPAARARRTSSRRPAPRRGSSTRSTAAKKPAAGRGGTPASRTPGAARRSSR